MRFSAVLVSSNELFDGSSIKLKEDSSKEFSGKVSVLVDVDSVVVVISTTFSSQEMVKDSSGCKFRS